MIMKKASICKVPEVIGSISMKIWCICKFDDHDWWSPDPPGVVTRAKTLLSTVLAPKTKLTDFFP